MGCFLNIKRKRNIFRSISNMFRKIIRRKNNVTVCRIHVTEDNMNNSLGDSSCDGEAMIKPGETMEDLKNGMCIQINTA